MVMGKEKFDWEKIRIDYEKGDYTMPQLAKKYGFSPQTGYKMSSLQGWKKGRLEHKLENQLEEKILDNEAKLRKETRVQYHLIFSRLRELIADEALSNEHPDRTKIKTLKLAVDALKDCKKAEWDILLLDQNLQNWSKKYKIMKKEVVEVIEEDESLADALMTLYRKSKGTDRFQSVGDVIDVTPDDVDEANSKEEKKEEEKEEN